MTDHPHPIVAAMLAEDDRRAQALHVMDAVQRLVPDAAVHDLDDIEDAITVAIREMDDPTAYAVVIDCTGYLRLDEWQTEHCLPLYDADYVARLDLLRTGAAWVLGREWLVFEIAHQINGDDQ